MELRWQPILASAASGFISSVRIVLIPSKEGLVGSASLRAIALVGALAIVTIKAPPPTAN